MKKILLSLLIMLLGLLTLTSCIGGVFEEEITVKFVYEDELIGSGVVTQFKNIQAPKLSEGYIYDGYKFFGWTALNNVKATDKDFKSEYIGDGKMVHYMDIKQYAKNNEVILKALLIDKNEIPREYHYVVIAWYDKTSTSGVSASQMEQLQNELFKYLRSEGVSEEDLNSIIIRGYSGNVGPSCGAIMNDGDVDIMLGWGSASNVIDTGGMKENMLLETVPFVVTYNGAIKNRTLHRLTDTESVVKVMDWLQSETVSKIFN